MKKLNLMPLILAGSMTVQTCLQPIAFATSTNTVTKAKTVHGVQMSTEAILAQYEAAIATAKNEQEVNLAVDSVTDKLTDSISPEMLQARLKAEYLKYDPAGYRMYSASTDETFAQTAQEVFSQRQSSGLFFKSKCNRDNRRLTAYILGGVAVIGGIVALVLNRSDASLKKKYDNLKLKRKKAFDDENYFITNAPELIARDNEALKRTITDKEASIVQQGLLLNEANTKIAEIDNIFTQYALGKITLTTEQANKYKAERDSWVAQKNSANSAIVNLTADIVQIEQKIQDNYDRIDYYSVQANVDYELNQASIAYNTDIAAYDVQLKNALATAPGKRKAAKVVAISSGVALATGVVFFATSNAGCGDT